MSTFTSGTVVLVLLLLTVVHSSRILIIPLSCGFNSRLLNMQKIADMVAEDGHEVTLLMNTRVMQHVTSKRATVVSYLAPENIRLITDWDMINELHLTITNIWTVANLGVNTINAFCDALLSDKVLLAELKSKQFDLIFMDIFQTECGRILLDYFDRPSILYQNFGFLHDCTVFYPQLPSFMCSSISPVCTSDQMTFKERTLNFVLVAFMNYVIKPYLRFNARTLIEKHQMNVSDLQNPVTKSIILVNTDFVFDYPRPMMPHVFAISGMFHTAPNPLDSDLAKFVDDSAPHGIVVLSFGTMITNFSRDRAEIISRVFGRLKQRVIWKYTGKPPADLAPNIWLTEWFPQNDILAHPLTRVFVTHCGISSSHEAVYNGVPVVAIPLFLDQPYNAQKLVNRLHMGVQLDYHTFTETQFEQALSEVMRNPTYASNAKNTADLLKDNPIHPKERVLHLFNYVIRHKGAKHLISDAVLKLNDFQMYSVDVIVFLLLITALLFGMFLLCAYKCFSKCCCKHLHNKRKEE